MAIEAVVFDIGNVLIRWQPELYYDALIGEARRRQMFSEVDLHAMNERIDAGDGLPAARAHAAAALELQARLAGSISRAAPRLSHSPSRSAPSVVSPARSGVINP